ncbi:cyclase family protein [Mesonia sp. K4-1]|jgi:arylformamidase|uniref:cyclase family protein n=1 Tax=Mesonia sp. K4-1 TaxID=2602760 RepID=UPI0011C8C4CA|nr:cyclase family protein [Mesonia sp. K4-1]TXK75962.1 cyclase family protein [Mesonia sp. K4-1]
MRAKVQIDHKEFTVNLNLPIDISLTLSAEKNNPSAWYVDAPKIQPVKDGDWVAKVSEGASVNFNNIYFNPHAHGTHTECVGHISEEFYSINDCLKQFFFTAKIITLTPEALGEDLVFSKRQIEQKFRQGEAQAIIIRTHPNSEAKKNRQYSHTNWPYLLEEAAEYLKECGVEHLLIDLPSVDKEKDDGKLLAHHAFWNYPENTRFSATITEMIYVPENVADGNYLLNLQIASFQNDASPSKPVLYKIEP